jgi:hypothetical protein
MKSQDLLHFYLRVPVPSQFWYARLCYNGCCIPLLDSLGGSWLGSFKISVSMWSAIWYSWDL